MIFQDFLGSMGTLDASLVLINSNSWFIVKPHASEVWKGESAVHGYAIQER